jgi:hypothetical protein
MRAMYPDAEGSWNATGPRSVTRCSAQKDRRFCCSPPGRWLPPDFDEPRHHFEQNFHVRQRLARYGARCCLDYPDTEPGALAAAMAEEIARPVSHRPVETDGAALAAAFLNELM